EALIFTEVRDGRSRIICGSGKAAGGHRSGRRRVRPPEKERPEFYRAVSVPCGKVAVVRGASDEADLSLLRMRRGRRRFQICDGDGEVCVSRSDSYRSGKMRHPRSAAERAFAGGA